MNFDLSIIVPFKDEVLLLQSLIAAISEQRSKYYFELIILDSSALMSHEKKIDFFGIPHQWVIIDPNSFNHGTTRNLGVGCSRADYILFTVQDALPIDVNWLNTSVSMIKKANIDACCGKQIVQHDWDKNPVEWNRPIDPPRFSKIEITSMDFICLNPTEKQSITRWDNVNAIYKRTALIDLPFREILFGEDAQWACDALLRGLNIGYNDFSIVFHYHHYSDDIAFKRFFADLYMQKIIYNIDPEIPRLSFRLILSWIKPIIKSRMSWKNSIFWFFYNFKLFSASRKSYNKYNSFNTQIEIENYLFNNSPISNTSKAT